MMDRTPPYLTTARILEKIAHMQHVEISRLRDENERLRAALEKVMVGGNHVALLIGADHPPYTASHNDALKHYGAGDQYEAWCCWRTIMEARDVLDPPCFSADQQPSG